MGGNAKNEVSVGCKVPAGVHQQFRRCVARRGLKINWVMRELMRGWVRGEIKLPDEERRGGDV